MVTTLPRTTEVAELARVKNQGWFHWRFTLRGQPFDASFFPPLDQLHITHVHTPAWMHVFQTTARGPGSVLQAVNTGLGHDYGPLIDLLGITNIDQQAKPFRPAQLLEAADAACVLHAAGRQGGPIPSALRDLIAEPDKPYFMGFRRDPPGQRPSSENQLKTTLLLGPHYAEFCAQRGRSTRWTSDASKALPIRLPEDHR